MAPGKKKVVRAMQRSSFNKDDLDRLRTLGLLGENNQGLMTLLAPEQVEAGQKAFVDALVREENEDREILMRRVIQTNEQLSENDWPRVQRTFAALNRDKARPGEMIQLESGEWVKKKAK